MQFQQLIEESAKFAEGAKSELNPDEISTVTQVKLAGRRIQDKENLQKQIVNEEAQTSHLT